MSEDLPDWVRWLPPEAIEAIDRYWKPVWDTLKLLPAHREHGEELELEAVEELEPGAQVAEPVRGDVARLPGVVPAGGRRRPPVVPRLPGGVRAAHARAGAHVRAADRARRRRRPRRADAQPLPPAGLRRRLLAGRLDARRAGAGAQLRLPGRPPRGDRLPDCLDRAPRARHERLPVGAARRDQRRRPGDLADVRRPAGRRRRVRDPDRRALRAGDVRHGARGAGRAGADPGARAAEPHAARPLGRLPHRLRRTGPATLVPRDRRDDQPPGEGGVARVRGGDPLRGARAVRARPARRPGHVTRAVHRGVPGAAAAQHAVRGRVRDALHRRLSPGGGQGGVLLARLFVGALARPVRRGQPDRADPRLERVD